MIERSFGTRLAARLFGVPILDRRRAEAPAERGDQAEWLSEPDDYEGAVELSLAPDSDIEEMLRARITGPAPQAKPVAEAAADRTLTRPASRRRTRREKCPKTTP